MTSRSPRTCRRRRTSEEIAGMFLVVLTARPRHSLAELEQAAMEEIDRLKREPPTAEEIARAVNAFEAQFIKSLEPIGEFSGRADQLNRYNVMTGDPGYMSKDFDRYLKVDPQAVQRGGEEYLGPGRVVVDVTPGSELSIKPDVLAEAAAAREEMAKQFRAAARRRPGRPPRRRPRTWTAPSCPGPRPRRSSSCRRSTADGSPTAWNSSWWRTTCCRW